MEPGQAELFKEWNGLDAMYSEVCGVVWEDLNIGSGWNGLGTMGTEGGWSSLDVCGYGRCSSHWCGMKVGFEMRLKFSHRWSYGISEMEAECQAQLSRNNAAGAISSPELAGENCIHSQDAFCPHLQVQGLPLFQTFLSRPSSYPPHPDSWYNYPFLSSSYLEISICYLLL